MFVLVRIDVNPGIAADGPGDCTEVTTTGFFGSLAEAQKKMKSEITALISKYNKKLEEEWKKEGGDVYLEEGDDFEFSDMSAWLSWPEPIKWQIIEASADKIAAKTEEAEEAEEEDTPQEPNTCPMCGAHIEHRDGGEEDGYGELFLYWTCERCGVTGTAIFNLSDGNKFMGHEID